MSLENAVKRRRSRGCRFVAIWDVGMAGGGGEWDAGFLWYCVFI